MSQSEWARRIGISKSYFSMLVSGSKRPSLDTALRIAEMTEGAVPVESWGQRSASQEDAALSAASRGDAPAGATRPRRAGTLA